MGSGTITLLSCKSAFLGGSDRTPRVEFRTVFEHFSVQDLAPHDCVLRFEMVKVQLARLAFIHPLI